MKESSLSASSEQNNNTANGNSTMNSVRRAFTRTRQYTMEKLGKSEVTEYGPEYNRLSGKVDTIKLHSERIVLEVGHFLQPNPTIRMEEYLMKKMSPTHGISIPQISLGESLTGYGKSHEGDFGAYLINSGNAHKSVGESRRKFMEESNAYLITPLKAFLDVDIRTAIYERKKLGYMRLDLDAAKSDYRKCTKTDKLKQFEARMVSDEEVYSEQYQRTVDCYKRIIEVHERHLDYFKKYIASYCKYMRSSIGHLENISTDPPSMPSNGDKNVDSVSGEKEGRLYTIGSEVKKAKAKFDYTPKGEDEISLLKDEVVMVTQENEAGFVHVEKINGETGGVPTAYLEFL